MSTLQIHLPEGLQERLAAKAAENGYGKIEEYVEALVEAECNDEYDEELEQLLIKRLGGGPSIEVTPEFIQQLKDEVSQRRGK